MENITPLNLTESEKFWTEKDGRIYFELVTLGLTVKEWMDRFKKDQRKIDDYAKMLLDEMLKSPSYYDRTHKYEPGKIIKVVLIKVKEINEIFERTTKNFKAIAEKDLGKNSVCELKAELVFLLYEKFSIKELKEIKLKYIVSPHKSIRDKIYRPGFFGIDIDYNELIAEGDNETEKSGLLRLWKEEGAFAFIEDIN